MKFVKDYMTTIEGISIFPMLSLLICLSFFLLLFWWVFGYTKKDVKEFSSMPLNDDEKNNTL